MSIEKLRLFVGNLPQKRVAEAILHTCNVEIVDAMTTSGAIMAAWTSLANHPERPVAVLINGPQGGDSIETKQERASGNRILASSGSRKWFFAMAVPRMDHWAMTDPRIKRDLDTYLDGKANFTERSLRIAELTKTTPFDPTELLRTNADFCGLVEFVQQHTPSAKKRGTAKVG